MRVVHLLASFDLGGAEQVALRLAREQSKSHDVSVWALTDGPLRPWAEEAGVSPQVIGKTGGFRPELIPRLAARFRRAGADVIHTHNPMTLTYGGPAARLAGAVMVHTKHGEGNDTGRRLRLRRWAARTVHAFVSVSEKTDRVARDRDEAPPATMMVIENGIDTDQFTRSVAARASYRDRLGVAEGTCVVGAVGRLMEVKNYALLIRALAPLLGDDMVLAFVGDGPMRGELEALVAELEISKHCHFLGMQKDVPGWLSAFDLLGISSHTEGLPLVLLEAMSSSVPAVSTAVGGIVDVLDEGKTGMLVPAGDEVALRHAIRSLSADPDKRHRFGEAARAHVIAHYGLKKMCQRYMAIYRRFSD